MDIGTAVAGGTGIVGSLMNIGAGRRQQRRSKELMDINQNHQMELNKQAQQISQENWDYTNVENQVKHIENAGLNVGMMYGGSGTGGASGASASGGSAGMASGAQDIPVNSGIGMDIMTQLAQVEAMKASANKANAEADNIRGAGTNNTNADTALKQMQTANLGIINNIGNKTIDEQILAIKANADKAQSEARTQLVGANVAETTQGSQETIIKNQAIASALEAGLKQSQINLSQAQIQNMAQQIAIGKFNANQSAEFKGLDTVAGSQVNKLINKIYEIFGVKAQTETQDKIK